MREEEIGEILFEKTLSEDLEKHLQVRMVINKFRGVEYLHIRKYYLSFEEEWMPTSEGICLPLDILTVVNLFDGVCQTIALAESTELINTHILPLLKKD